MLGWLNVSLKCMETRETFQLLAVLKLCQNAAPDATSLHHCLKNKQLKLIMASVVRVQVFSMYYAQLRMVWLILAYD